MRIIRTAALLPCTSLVPSNRGGDVAQLVPSLVAFVTISALLHDGYYDEKKEKEAHGDVGHNSCLG